MLSFAEQTLSQPQKLVAVNNGGINLLRCSNPLRGYVALLRKLYIAFQTRLCSRCSRVSKVVGEIDILANSEAVTNLLHGSGLNVAERQFSQFRAICAAVEQSPRLQTNWRLPCVCVGAYVTMRRMRIDTHDQLGDGAEGALQNMH